jgi:hypothetical protein
VFRLHERNEVGVADAARQQGEHQNFRETKEHHGGLLFEAIDGYSLLIRPRSVTICVAQANS